MYTSVLSLAVLFGAVSCVYYPAAWNQIRSAPSIPSCQLGNQLRFLPMFVIPDRQLNIQQDYRTRYFTEAPALVQFIGQPQPLPAVRVVLPTPIHVNTWKSFVEFPTSFTIFQDGYRLPFPVSALYAPLPEYQFLRNPTIQVVYAVPTAPARLPEPTTTTTTPAPYEPSRNITILHFPEVLAQPDVLFHVEDDDELGGRNPPIPVIPAGIVQSSAPISDFTTFINSKESPVLQAIREESNRLKLRL